MKKVIMKKVSLFALVLAAGTTVMAQSQDPNTAHKALRTEMSVQPRFGLRGGVSLSSLEFDDDYEGTTYNMEHKTTFHAGAFVNIPLGGIFRVQPEISYFGGGGKVHGPLVYDQNSINGIPATANYNYELDMHYLSLPVMFQLQTPGGFFVEAGPQASYLIKGQQEVTNGGKVDLRDKKLVRKSEFGAAGGIGYLSRIGLGLNARYYHGLSNVFNSDEAPTGTENREISNRSIQIGLVYQFGAYK